MYINSLGQDRKLTLSIAWLSQASQEADYEIQQVILLLSEQLVSNKSVECGVLRKKMTVIQNRCHRGCRLTQEGGEHPHQRPQHQWCELQINEFTLANKNYNTTFLPRNN